MIRAQKFGATDPEHDLMPKHLSRIMYGSHKGNRGYDPTQHQRYWDTAWHSLTRAVRCTQCGELQKPADCCRVESCNSDVRGIIKSENRGPPVS